MTAFASTDELGSGLDLARAQAALDAASQQIRDECGWSITEETVIATLEGSGKREIWLPTLRLTAVTSVVEDGKTLTVNTDYRWTRYGRLLRLGRSWVCDERSVVVTYTHGYAAGAVALASVKAACLDLARRIYDGKMGVRSYAVDDVSETFADYDAGNPTLASYRLPAFA